MNLRSITLRDWKLYPSARFEFPKATTNQNVILIGAANGFGKTSFFEAVVLGLYGREGLPLIARASFADNADDRLQFGYKKFLEAALHKRALTEGRDSCSVELEFEDDDDEPLVLQRRWHFTSSGTYKPQDDQFLIYEGLARRPVGPPALQSDKAGWYRDYVARRFLPYYLAAFFRLTASRCVNSPRGTWIPR